MPAKFEKIAFVSSKTTVAEQAAARMRKRYGAHEVSDADIIVALGGDGLMLETLHSLSNGKVPVYGMNCGSIGFLMNNFEEERLEERLGAALPAAIHPLRMTVRDLDGNTHIALAYNEVSLFRTTFQAAKIRIAVDGKVRLEELICDGVMVATPAGSTAYNLSAHGPILPIDSPLLVLTPISPFRPRRWRGAILPNRASVKFTTQEAEKRPVSAVADNVEFTQVAEVEVVQDKGQAVTLLFDSGHSLEERVLNEQFQY